MSSVGYASMPVVPSLRGMRAVLEKQLQGPLDAASKKAGATLSKGLTDGVEKASKDVVRARKAEADAAQEVAQAEEKVADARDKAEVRAKSVEQAELALQAARLSSDGAVEKAEQSLAKLRESGTATTEELSTAERKLEQVRAAEASKVLGKENALERARQGATKATKDAEKAATDLTGKQSKLADAQDNVTAASRRLERSQDGAEESTSKLKMSFGDAESAASGFAAKLGDLVKVGGGLAGIAGVGATFAEGFQAQGQIDLMNRQLGLTGQVAAELGDEVRDVMSSGVAGGAEEAAAAVGALSSQFAYLGFEGEQTAGELSDNFLAFSNTFGTDMAEATQTAGQLVLNGLAPDVESAADLMTAAMQRVPKAMRDELPEIMNEYGTNFRALGFSGEESFGLLVSAAEQGKFALDKTGDSLKEFTIRGADMSKASTEAYELIGLSAEDMSAKVASGGPAAREALMATAEGLLGVENPAERANAAIALFGTPLEDLSVDQIPQFLEGLTGAGDAMAGFQGSSQELADQIANSFQGRMDALKGTVVSLATDGFMRVWDTVQNRVVPAFQSAGELIQRNRAWLEPLTVVVGAAATAWGLWVGAIKTWQMVTKIATGIQAAFNAVLAANPIMLIVVAVAALAAGLTYFFMKTETGQKIWSGFMDVLSSAGEWLSTTFAPIFSWIGDVATSAWEGIKTGWEVLAQAFRSAWDNILAPVFSFLAEAVKVAAAILLTVLITPAIIAWNHLSTAFQAAWTSVLKPVFDALATAASWVWNAVLMPVFGWIRTGFEAVGAAFSWVWSTSIKPTWDALGAGIRWVYDTLVQPVFDLIRTGLDLLGQAFSWAWNSVIKPIWDGLGAGIRWVADSVIHPVFDGIQRGLDLVKGAFRTAVDIIGSVWDEIREKTAAPIRFVIDRVYNDGIVSVWNKVAGWAGLDDKKLEPMERNFATGTSQVLPGYTPGRDPFTFIEPTTGMQIGLGGGEGIARPELVRAVGPDRWDSLNAAAKIGGVAGVRKELGNFASGGVVGSISDLVNRYFPGMSITSTVRPGDPGHHGSGHAVDFSNGFDTTPEMQAAARFFHDNYAPGLYELIHWPLNGWQNIKNGAPLNYGEPTNSQHRNHVHVAAPSPLSPPGSDIVPIPSGSAGTGGGMLRRLAEGVFSQIVDPLIDKIPAGGGMWGELPKGFAEKTVGVFRDFVMSKLPAGGGGSSANGSWVGTPGVEQWRPLVEKLLEVKGQPLSLVGSVLRRMNQESGGDPNAINLWDSNAAAGIPSKSLMQVIDPTFQAHKDPGFDDIWDPESNIRASMNYAIAQYGGLAAAYDRAGGYDNGGWLMPGTTLGINESGKPEPVFTNSQWTLMKSMFISTAQLLDPIRLLAARGRDAIAHLAQIADDTRRGVQQRVDGAIGAAGAAVWAALPGEVREAFTVAQAVGAQWERVSGYLNEKAIAWSKGEWPIGGARTPVVEPGPGWKQFRLDDSLEEVARANADLAEQVIAGKVSPGNDTVANALFDIFGRDRILPDLARIAAAGPNAIEAATTAAMHAFETGETARLEEWTASNSQLTEAVLRARDAAIVTGEMVQGAVNGYLNWAMASDTQGRQGSWQEYFQHYGGEYGTAQGDWLLSQVGFGGILGGKLKDSAANLLIEAAKSPLLAAPAILDDDGRVIGSQLDRQPDLAQMDRSGYTALSPSTSDSGTVPAPAGEKSVVIEVQGTHVSVDELEKAVGSLNDEVKGVKVEVKRMQNQTAEVTSGVSLMV